MDFDYSSVGERVKFLRTYFKLSQTEFGAKLGISRDAVNNIERARTKNFPESTIKLICATYNVDYLWLTEGVGEMFSAKDGDLMTLIDNLMSGENETAKSVFKAFAYLDDSEWLVIQKLIDSLQKK